MLSAGRAAICLALFAAHLFGQTTVEEVAIHTHPYTPPSLVLQAESNLVETGLTVRDAHGHAVAGLKASDFEVFDNGVPQTITAFSELRSSAGNAATPGARFVTFFFDDLHMGFPGPGGYFSLPFVKKAARDFAEKHLRPGDRISIATTSGMEFLDFTDDAKLFDAKISRLNLHAHRVLSREEYQAESVSTLAALQGAAQRLSGMRGARVLIFISAGFVIYTGVATDVQPEIDKVIDAAVRWNVTIPAIDAKALSTMPGGVMAAMNRPLWEISSGTGGHLFENSNDLVGSMELAANPEVTYSLGFTPGARDGRFHTLKIRFASKREGSLEFRPGYFSNKDEALEKKRAARASFDAAVLSKETLRGIPVKVSVEGEAPKDGAVPVSINVTLDLNGLQFVMDRGRHAQQLALLIALLDSSGGFVTGKESIVDLTLSEAKLALLRRDGLKTVATIQAAPGLYQVRTVVREGVKGGLAASTVAVELRDKP
jgi:VWFA-related protein